MGRHALVYRNQRQRWLARKIAPRQPIVARIARHQRLLRELMPPAGTSERTGILPERSFNWAGQRALPLARPLFRSLLVGEAEEERAFSSVPSPIPDLLLAGKDEEDPGQEATFALTAANAMDRTEIGPSSLPDKPEMVSSQQEVHVESVNQFLEVGGQELASMDRLPETQMSEPLEVQEQDLLQDRQIMESAAASDRSPEAPSAHRENNDQSSGINETVEAKLQQEQKIVDERRQPIENAKTRSSRGRIQEQPVEPGNTSPAQAAPPSPPSRMAHRKEQEMVSEEASEADDLFAPRDTDRSPQAWMARLMGANSVPSNDIATPSTTVETEPGGMETRSVTGEQPERRQQPTDSDQFIPPVRQSRFAPANEGRAALTPQTDQGRRLKAGGQSLPAARANIASDTSEAHPAPTPLSQRARRFLQPLVGIDPASVHVHRDAIAEHLADVYQADAFTVGDDVAIAAGHPDDTPETLGLLAHEFTHVARQREPRFVPPIARVMNSASSSANMPGNMTPGRLSAPIDEEALAQRVEGRVTRAAQEQADQATASSMTPSAGGPVAETTRSVPETRSGDGSWGGLPAPWEPLPAWLVSSPASTEDGEHAAVVAPQPPQITHEVGGAESGLSGAYGGGSTWNGSGPGDTGVQRAGLERNLGEVEQTTAPMQQAALETAKAPEADLDMLARQVYTLLKRRLEVERRRES